MIQRGIDRGEFRPMDAKKAVYVVMAPLLFLALWTHSFGTLKDASEQLNPEEFLATHLDTLLQGLCLPATKAAPSLAAQGIITASL